MAHLSSQKSFAPPGEELSLHLAIGMPAVLPQDAQFTVTAQRWADDRALCALRSRLEVELPTHRSTIGRAPLVVPQIQIIGCSENGYTERAEAIAVEAAIAVLREVRSEIQGLDIVPGGAVVIRQLEKAARACPDGGIDGCALKLRELSPSQCLLLVERGWRQRVCDLDICLTTEAAEREEIWLGEQNFIGRP